MKPKRIILASKSPRRKEILNQMGIDPQIVVSNFDESCVEEVRPQKLVELLAKGKARTVAEESEVGDMIIAADTVVSIDGKILGKPKTKKEAFEMIQTLAGRTHIVCSGVCIIYKKKSGDVEESFVETTKVHVDRLTNCEIHKYVDSGEPMDKAGGYGIQGIFGKHITGIDGDYYNVVGLPMQKTYRAIKRLSR